MIRASRALTVARAEGTCLEWDNGLLGFVLCRGTRHGGQPISANRLSQRRAVNAGIRTWRGCRLAHDGDRRGMALQVQQVLGQNARDLVGLSDGSTQPMSQSHDVRAGPAELLDLGN
jgi:hypothetical protein